MMHTIFVDAAPGFETQIERELVALPHVLAVTREAWGRFDLVVLVDAGDPLLVQALIRHGIERIPGVLEVRRLERPGWMARIRDLFGQRVPGGAV